jgi:23S rRNA (cytidine1920-2'-O)/16S rRNA (cytidine1409-2'-O)-methyltransferase
MRLDAYLVQERLFESRNKAQEAITQGMVMVDGVRATKHAHTIAPEEKVEVLAHSQYVSRAGEKLALFLTSYFVPIDGKRCLDVGSSTGGFTQVLLAQGAYHVSAVDVGKEQLHERLRNDPRVGVYEETNITAFYANEPFEVVTCDVSFVGLETLMPAIDACASEDIVILFKPQFEVGKAAKRTKKGVVKDNVAIMQARRRFEIAAAGLGWQLAHVEASQIKGKEGNVEFFYAFKKR